MCPVSNPNAVEPGTFATSCEVGLPYALNGIGLVLHVVAVDSTRYFVLRLDDGKGHHAFVGLGFQNRYRAANSTGIWRLSLMSMSRIVEKRPLISR